MREDKDGEPFLVKPETDKYEVISFLVRNRKSSFTPSEIASDLDIADQTVSNVLSYLLKHGTAVRSQGEYYLNSESAKYLQQRLKSVDSAKQLHDIASNNDAYSENGWEEKLDSCEHNNP